MQSRVMPVLVATTALALSPTPAAAQDSAAEAEAIASRLEAAPTLHGKLALSLADAIEMGLENNLDVEVERHEPLIAAENLDIAWGAFDPTLFSELRHSTSRSPTGNALIQADISKNTEEPAGTGGVRGILPLLGSEYGFEFTGNQQTTNAGINLLSPEFHSGFSLRFNQPLLKDLIWNEPWTRVKSSHLLAQTSREDFRQSLMDVLERIEKAYWDLVARDDQVRVAKKSLEFAGVQLDQTRTQYEVGVVSRVEVVEAEAGVAERELNLIRTRNDYRNAQDTLIDLVLGAGLHAESTLEIEPTDRPEEYVPYEVDVPGAVSQALQHRPEMAIARRRIEERDVQRKFRWNQQLPQVDFVLTWGQAGIAGRQNPNFNCNFSPDDPTTPQDENAQCQSGTLPIPNRTFASSFDRWSDADSLTVGGALSIPFPNRSARSAHDRSQLELRRARTEKRRLEQTIIVDVRIKARNLEAAQEGIEAAERRRIAAEEQLRAERIRLEYGESTPFDVLLRERDLVEAENQKIQAFQIYRNSVTELDRAQGTILRNRNVRFDEVSALRLDVR